jgi:hypothetical protein
MKAWVATLGALVGFVVLLSWSVPAQAAAGDGAVTGGVDPGFHALHRMPDEARSSLVPLTDDELASVTGAAGFGFGFGANLGVIVQINVCAICANVRQENGAVQSLVRFPAPR